MHKIQREETLTLAAFLPRFPTITLTWKRFDCSASVAGDGASCASGVKAALNGMLTLPGMIPRANLHHIVKKSRASLAMKFLPEKVSLKTA